MALSGERTCRSVADSARASCAVLGLHTKGRCSGPLQPTRGAHVLPGKEGSPAAWFFIPPCCAKTTVREGLSRCADSANEVSLRSVSSMRCRAGSRTAFSSLQVPNHGEGGIRTLGSLLDYDALAKRCFRPLSHLTNWFVTIGEDFHANRLNCQPCSVFPARQANLRPSPRRETRPRVAVACGNSIKDLRKRWNHPMKRNCSGSLRAVAAPVPGA